MPYIFDQSEIEWPDDDSEPPAPTPYEFVSLTPHDYNGIREPVDFEVPTLADLTEPAGPAEPKPTIIRWSSWLSRLRTPKAQMFSSQYSGDQAHLALLAIVVPALRRIGVRSLYCRIDGGNDEGFSWLDGATLRSGERIDAAAVSERLGGSRVLHQIESAGLAGVAGTGAAADQMQDILDIWLCSEWAALLLGRGFGTGEYSMYGAFTVDLDTCTITDDRNADPIVKNISVAT